MRGDKRANGGCRCAVAANRLKQKERVEWHSVKNGHGGIKRRRVLLTRRLGRKPSKRLMEMLASHQMKRASDEDLAQAVREERCRAAHVRQPRYGTLLKNRKAESARSAGRCRVRAAHAREPGSMERARPCWGSDKQWLNAVTPKTPARFFSRPKHDRCEHYWLQTGAPSTDCREDRVSPISTTHDDWP
ncbi:MAG: hypothetical protein JWR15_2255 [Prosthecobacter sp.]|nr:hypothetical protein [Prosthecobacter sp.]